MTGTTPYAVYTACPIHANLEKTAVQYKGFLEDNAKDNAKGDATMTRKAESRLMSNRWTRAVKEEG